MVLFSQQVARGQWKTNLSPTGSWDQRAGGIDGEEVKQKESEGEVKREIEGRVGDEKTERERECNLATTSGSFGQRTRKDKLKRSEI